MFRSIDSGIRNLGFGARLLVLVATLLTMVLIGKTSVRVADLDNEMALTVIKFLGVLIALYILGRR